MECPDGKCPRPRVSLEKRTEWVSKKRRRDVDDAKVLKARDLLQSSAGKDVDIVKITKLDRHLVPTRVRDKMERLLVSRDLIKKAKHYKKEPKDNKVVTFKGMMDASEQDKAVMAIMEAVNDEEEGGVREDAFAVYKTLDAIQVYRAWHWNETSDKPDFAELGAWWSWTVPVGDMALYRKENAICPGWNGIDRMTSAYIPPGTLIICGMTQSAKCSQFMYYDKSDNVQIYVPDSRRVMRPIARFTGSIMWKDASGSIIYREPGDKTKHNVGDADLHRARA